MYRPSSATPLLRFEQLDLEPLLAERLRIVGRVDHPFEIGAAVEQLGRHPERAPERVRETEGTGIGQDSEQPERGRAGLDAARKFERDFGRDLARRRRVRNHEVPARADIVADMVVDIQHRRRFQLRQRGAPDCGTAGDPLPVRAVEQQDQVVIAELLRRQRLLAGTDQLRVARRGGSGEIRLGPLAAAVAQELLHPERGPECVAVGAFMRQNQDPLFFLQQFRRFGEGDRFTHRARIPPFRPAGAAPAPGRPFPCGCRAGSPAPAYA